VERIEAFHASRTSVESDTFAVLYEEAGMNRRERRTRAVLGRRNQTKPRKPELVVDFGRPVILRRAGMDLATGGWEFYDPDGHRLMPVGARATVSYPRTKGRKVVTEAHVSTDAPVWEPDADLVRSDLFIAVDTNTKVIRGERVSVTGSALGRGNRPVMLPKPVMEGVEFEIALPPFALEFRNAADPEVVGWQLILEALLMSPVYDPASRVTLIVDSHLGDIPRYNDRSLPICGDFFLPGNVRLLYASSDVGKERISNQLIAVADREARNVLRQIEAGEGAPEDLLDAVDRPYESFRAWELVELPVVPSQVRQSG
jgi:hypothetical protein